MKNLTRIIAFIILILIHSCSQSGEEKSKPKKYKQKHQVNYAKRFNINFLKNKKELTITKPFPNSAASFNYVFIDNQLDSKKFSLQLPVNRIIVSSTTHISMLEELNQENSLVGFQNTEYVSSPKTRKLIDQGKIRELGKKGALNSEVVIDIKPQLIVGFAMSANSRVYQSVENADIPVILNADWLEATPLGRAEWIKFFGFLFDKSQLADSIFQQIETDYLKARELASKSNSSPTVLSGAIMSKDIWNLPAGDSFVAQFLRDANTNYLWKNSEGQGSLSLSFESVLDKAKEASIWIAPGYFTSKEQLIKSNEKYAEFKAYKTDNIYTFANTKGPTGGVIYYELGPTRPDLVLKDIIKICHPDLLPNYELTFFERMK